MSRAGLSAVTSKQSASLRHQRVLLVKARLGDGYTGAFEVICCDCGNHTSLGYSQVPGPAAVAPRPVRHDRGPGQLIAGAVRPLGGRTRLSGSETGFGTHGACGLVDTTATLTATGAAIGPGLRAVAADLDLTSLLRA